MKTHTVTDADDGIRLDRWFKRHYPGLPHALLEKHLRKGAVRVDGKKAKSSDRIEAGQGIEVRFSMDTPYPQTPKSYPLTLEDARMMQDAMLYKDERLLVINKPAGIAVQGGSKISKSIDGLLDALIYDAETRPKLTHRLDRDTSGVLVLARHTQSAHALMQLFSRRKIDKTYWALVVGLPDPLRGTIDLPMRKKNDPKADALRKGLVAPEHGEGGRDYEIMHIDEEEGQKAVTEYRVLDTLARRFALVELKPLTGRTHQLRVHMAAIGCPILGDHKYGGSMTDAKGIGVENVLHLHARSIHIPGFGGGKAVEVSAPLPPHMEQSFRALGLDVPKK